MKTNSEAFASNPNDGSALELFGIAHVEQEDDDWLTCQRHGVEKERIVITVRKDGAIYGAGGPVFGLTCERCAAEYAMMEGEDAPGKYIQAMTAKLFERWDNGETREDLFEFMGETA